MTRGLGEFRSRVRRTSEQLASLDSELTELVIAWEANPTFGMASDLVSAAFVTGKMDVAAPAVAQLAQSSHSLPASLKEMLARFKIDTHESESSPPETSQMLPARSLVRAARWRLRNDPRDVLARVDLALAYVSIGKHPAAEREMRVALSLDPLNRFVVRSAARLFVHFEQPDRALRLLRANRRTPEDPWLLSAELATSSAAKKQPRFARQAAQVLEQKNWNDRSLSELRTALGTLEFSAGNGRVARRLLTMSLEDATENAVAQARWMQSQGANVQVTEALRSPRTFEARALDAYHAEGWADCIENATEWLDDQPFSSRPAILGSFAAVVGPADYGLGARLSERGLAANPRDPTLLNNLALCQARQGFLREAAATLARTRPLPLTDVERSMITATRGLVAFRQGDLPAARTHYADAVRSFQLRGEFESAGVAALFWAEEERAVGAMDQFELRYHEALAISKARVNPVLATLSRRLEPPN